MSFDVLDVRSFYATTLGQVAQRLVRERLRTLWPSTHGLTVVGLGYALPYLSPFLVESQRTFALMPHTLGACPWPEGKKSLVTLCDPLALPLPDQSVDRLMIVHGLEVLGHTPELLREIWRVLKGEGRLVCVVPNRLGLWARREMTPFAAGSPYSQRQLEVLLRSCMFDPVGAHTCLFIPPTHSRTLLATANTWERISSRWLHGVGGVLMVEAVKQVYGCTPSGPRGKLLKVRQTVPTGMGS